MNKQTKTSETRKFMGDRLIQKGRKLGRTRPRPQTPSGKVKQWQPPSKGTTPADRNRDAQ